MINKKKGKHLPTSFYFIIFFVVLMSIVLIFTALYQNFNRDTILSSYKVSAVNKIEIQKRLMLYHYRTIKSELLFLPRLNEMLRFKEIKTEEDRKQIENEFFEFISTSGIYDQIRYIDNTGMEITRIDYNDGRPSVTPKEQLQDKSQRYYFKESINIAENRVYISPFDLNIEHGKIEQPRKPMIRFGTPVYNQKKEVKGIIVINFLGQILLEDLEEATNSHKGHFSLLNTEGYWLYNNNPQDEWGFMFEDKQNVRISERNPELWRKISTSESIQIVTDEAIYTSARVVPLANERNMANNRFYHILYTIPLNEINIDDAAQKKKFLKVTIIALIINTIFSVFFTGIIVQRNKYREALEKSALYDQLTGLPNRKLLEERAQQVSIHSKRYKHSYAVMFIDLDGFKAVNDELGHKAGDVLLTEVGKLLNNCVRESDTVARFGGDEFVILLSHIAEVKDCAVIAEKILSKMFKPFFIEEKEIRIGASFGIAVVLESSETNFEQAMRAADLAMYDIKKSGKNNYKIVSV